MGETKYTKKDAAKETKSSEKEVANAWHTARNDAADEDGWGVPENRHDTSNNDK